MIAHTGPGAVALVDNVSGQAFGPTFDSADHINDFTDWSHTYFGLTADPRRLEPAMLTDRIAHWKRERLDSDGELREVPAARPTGADHFNPADEVGARRREHASGQADSPDAA